MMAHYPKLTKFDIFNTDYPAVPLNHLVKLDDKYHFGAINFRDYIHIASNLMKHDSSNDIEVLKVHINLDTIMKNYMSEKNFDNSFRNIFAGIYNKNMRIEGHNLVRLLNKLFTTNSPIFIYMTLYNYDMERDDITNYNNMSESHAVSLTLLPVKKGKYKAIYFNSHGNKIMKYTSFKKYHTRTRTHDCDFGESIDMLIISNLINYLNSCIPDIEIVYEKTEQYNYLGPDLQACDNIGICYLFPFYLFHELCYHLREQHVIKDELSETERRFVSYYSLLQVGKINMVIYIILSKLLKDFKSVFINNLRCSSTSLCLHNNMIKDVEELFCNDENYYLHRMMYPGIGYLLQPAIKKIIVGE